MNTLVIGCGYLGSALADSLAEEGHGCVTADCLEGRGDYLVDLADRNSVLGLAAVLQKEGKGGVAPACVFLCASTAGGGEDAYRKVYEEGARNVVEAFPGSRVVMCSSTSVYDVGDGQWVTEVHSCHPATPRAKSLLEAEKTVLSSSGIVARLSAIYGPGRCVVLSRFANEARVIGEKSRWVNYIHRDDAASALILLASSPDARGRRFNVSDTSPMQMGDIYEVLSDALDLPIPTPAPFSGQIEDKRRRGRSNQRVSCSLLLSMGWSPLYPSFADGIYNVLEAVEEQ